MRAKCARIGSVQVLPSSEREACDPPESTVAGGMPVYKTRSSRDTLTVSNLFAIAGMIEPDPEAVRDWYADTSIASLNGLTAETLVAQGRAGEVLGFLLAALDQDD